MPHLTKLSLMSADAVGGGVNTRDASFNPFILTDVLWSNKLEAPEAKETHDPQDLHIPALSLDLPAHGTNDNLPTLLQLPPLDISRLRSFDRPEYHLDASVSSLSPSENEAAPSGSDNPFLDEDIWKTAGQLKPVNNDTRLLTWEAFTGSLYENVEPLLISEAPAATFDAALQLQARKSKGVLKAGTVVRSDVLLHSLWQLALGRASTLFPRVEDSFHRAIGDQRLSGCSLGLCQSFFSNIDSLGTGLIRLRAFKDNVYGSPETLPSLVGLAGALDAIVSAVEQYIVEHPRTIETPLQLQALVSPAIQIIDVGRQLIDATRDSKSEPEALSKAFEQSQRLQDCGYHVPLVFAILQRMSGPWLEKTTRFLTATDKEACTDTSGTPSFISADNAHLIENIRRCSLFLQNYPSPHLSQLVHSNTPLELGFTHEDLERINAKAWQFKSNLHSALSDLRATKALSPDPKTCYSPRASTNKAFNWELNLEDSVTHLSTLALPQTSASVHDIHQIVTSHFLGVPKEQSLFHPPISLIPNLSLRPFLTAKSAALTTLSLRSLLVDHRLLYHLKLLQQFYLCGSGVFIALLQTALFSPEVEAVERNKGIVRTGARTMGLKLGSGERREWPPASSELTLALMGVLNEGWSSFNQSISQSNINTKTAQDSGSPELTSRKVLNDDRSRMLPGNLSFAVRTTLSEEQIEKTLNPATIFALDFLCLAYNPSAALAEVITTSCLEKYDKIFKLLLRMIRMQFVIGELFRDIGMSRRPNSALKQQGDQLVHKFRHRATHVVTSLCSFFHQTISEKLAKFHDYILLLEVKHTRTPSNVTSQEMDTTSLTLSSLADLHSRCLSTIATCLFQRKRQSKASDLLEEMLNCILSFSTIMREQRHLSPCADQKIRGLEELFVKFNSTFNNLQTSITEICVKMELSESSARRAAADRTGGAVINDVSEGAEAATNLRELLSMLDIPN